MQEEYYPMYCCLCGSKRVAYRKYSRIYNIVKGGEKMPQNIFKIYDGRTNFWQWDTKQKLIVLDDNITEVHFSNRNMTHSVKKNVYEQDEMRLCNVPSELLQLPRNLVAYAMLDGATVKSVKFAVVKRPMPSDYIADKSDEIEEKFAQIDIRLDSLNENKADDICYNEEENYIQLVANGEPIGSRVELPDGGVCGIEDFKINEDGHLVVTLSDGRVIDAGYVGNVDGVTFIPHISDDLILYWTNNGGLDNPKPVDLNPHDNWAEINGVESASDYIWEPL